MKKEIELTRIKNDINGNSRFACHYLNFITDEEKESIKQDCLRIYNETGKYLIPVNVQYNIALYKARKIGGKKFHNKQYGGGIIFQGAKDEIIYNINSLL